MLTAGSAVAGVLPARDDPRGRVAVLAAAQAPAHAAALQCGRCSSYALHPKHCVFVCDHVLNPSPPGAPTQPHGSVQDCDLVSLVAAVEPPPFVSKVKKIITDESVKKAEAAKV